MENNIVSLAYIIKDTAQPEICGVFYHYVIQSLYLFIIFFYWKFARLSFTSALSSISEIA